MDKGSANMKHILPLTDDELAELELLVTPGEPFVVGSRLDIADYAIKTNVLTIRRLLATIAVRENLIEGMFNLLKSYSKNEKV